MNMKYNYVLQINGNKAWNLLNQAIIKHKIVDIVKCNNVHPPVGPLVFQSEDVFFRPCDGNHIYYWLNNAKFPDIKNIYLDCHYEPQVYMRFDPKVNIYITENTIKCNLKIENNRIKVGNRHITVITKNYLNYLLKISTDRNLKRE